MRSSGARRAASTARRSTTSRRRFPDARFLWIDIEDDAALVDGVDVETFPTLLIAAGGEPRFFGPLAPHAETLVALVRAHAGEDVRALPDASLRAVARLASRQRTSSTRPRCLPAGKME